MNVTKTGLWLAIGLIIFTALAFRLWGLGSSPSRTPEDQWYATPVLYYLGADVINSREARVLRDPSEFDRISAPRIWLLKFDGLPDNQGALLEQRKYRPTRSFSVRGAEARLFERSSP